MKLQKFQNGILNSENSKVFEFKSAKTERYTEKSRVDLSWKNIETGN